MKSQSLLSNKKNYFLNWNTDKKKVVLQYFFTNVTCEKIGDESSGDEVSCTHIFTALRHGQAEKLLPSTYK